MIYVAILLARIDYSETTLLPHWISSAAEFGKRPLIAGFPGEREDDADRTFDYVSTSPLTYLHVFPYSPRAATEASEFSGRVAGPLVRERARALRDVGASLSRRFCESQIGTVRSGLTFEGSAVVLTDNYMKVAVPPGRAGNQRVDVRITGAEPLTGVFE